MSQYILVINGVRRKVTRREFKLHHDLETLYRDRVFCTNWLSELDKQRPLTLNEHEKFEMLVD